MNKHTYRLVVSAMLSAVAFVLMFIEWAIPQVIPSFVKMDISDIPALMGAYALGPVHGLIISGLKNILHAFIKGTSTGYIGELANFLLGTAFTVTAGLIYYFNKNKKGAVISALVGSLVMGIVSIPVNMFITYPFYCSAFFGGDMEKIIAMYKAIWSGADELWKCLVYFNAPFTFVKGLLCSIVVIFIYKPLSPLLHGRNGD